MKTHASLALIFSALVVQGCAIGHSGPGSAARLTCASDTEAIVDLNSDEGQLCVWFLPPYPWWVFLPGFRRLEHYRLDVRLDAATRSTVLLSIQGHTTISSGLSAPTSAPPGPSNRVLQTRYAADAAYAGVLSRSSRDKQYAVDAQQVDGRWIVLMDNFPGPDVCSLLGDDGKIIASLDTAPLAVDPKAGVTPFVYLTWDTKDRCIIFDHDRFGSNDRISSPEIDVWYYERSPHDIQVYDTNLGQYFVWRHGGAEPREQYKSLLR